MKVIDSFGRLARKQQAEYETLRQSLRQGKIESSEDASRLITNIRQRALFAAVLVVGAGAVITFFQPAFSGMVASFAALILLWLLSITLRGTRFIRRYVEEELGGWNEAPD